MKTRILFIHHTTAISGATNSLLYTIEQIPKDRYTCSVLFLQKEGAALELFRERGIPTDTLDGITNYQHVNGGYIRWIDRKPFKPVTQFIQMLQSVSRMEGYLKKHRHEFDMVHINTSIMLSAGLACRKLKIPLVWHVREHLHSGIIGIRKHIVRFIIKWCATRIIVISEADKSRLGHCSKCTVIYNFVDFNRFNREKVKYNLHTELGLNPETKIITMLGGIGHSKGAHVLLKALPLVLKKQPNVHVVIVGTPPVKRTNRRVFFKSSVSEKCLDIIDKNNLSSKVSFLGIRTDIPEILSDTYLLVWPATVAHFSRPILEAQAMGVPAIGTHFQVTRELIQHEHTGMLFENKNPVDLSYCMDTLLRKPDVYEAVSDEAYKKARITHDALVNIRQIIHVYQSISHN